MSILYGIGKKLNIKSAEVSFIPQSNLKSKNLKIFLCLELKIIYKPIS